MAASVLGKRQRGALQSEGTTESALAFLLTAPPRFTDIMLFSSCITGAHFQQASSSNTSHSPGRKPVVCLIVAPTAFSGEELQSDCRRKSTRKR